MHQDNKVTLKGVLFVKCDLRLDLCHMTMMIYGVFPYIRANHFFSNLKKFIRQVCPLYCIKVVRPYSVCDLDFLKHNL